MTSPVRFDQQKDKDDVTDTALLQAVAGGDRLAFRQLYDRYYRRVHGFAYRLVLRSDRADEVANDAMVAVWRGAEGFQGRAPVSSWIYGIVYRVAKKSHRFVRFEFRHIEITEGEELADEEVAPIDVFERRRVAAALARLPVDLRLVVELTYYDDMSCAEIAQIVGCPVGTVKSRMSRARACLRDDLVECAQR